MSKRMLKIGENAIEDILTLLNIIDTNRDNVEEISSSIEDITIKLEIDGNDDEFPISERSLVIEVNEE